MRPRDGGGRFQSEDKQKRVFHSVGLFVWMADGAADEPDVAVRTDSSSVQICLCFGVSAISIVTAGELQF